jgi:hypothetical protein
LTFIRQKPIFGEMNKKKPIFWAFRRHTSCECGYVFHENEKSIYMQDFIDCPRCNARMSEEEFWNFNHEKWDRTADLTNEQYD